MRIHALLLLIPLALTACGGSDSSSGPRTFRPVNDDVATVWDRQTTETAELLGEFVNEFNDANPGLDIKLVHNGNYGDIYRKVTTGIQAGVLPAMAVAYETMTSEYVRKGAAVELDSFIADPEVGLSEDDLNDFFPALIQTNQYPEFGGKTYSFPFTKSVLLMYTNQRVLREAGIAAPPKTWDEFLDQCRRIKTATGNAALSVDVSASTFVAMVYSMGGEVMNGREPLFDSPEALQALQLIETLVEEGLAYQNQPGTFEDQTSFGQDRLAFNFRPSSSLFYVARMMEDYNDWSVHMIPQNNPEDPATVLYGANVCIFNTDPAHQEAAWRFVRYFTSPEVTARWAMGTGYLPVRKSAAESSMMKQFFDRHAHHRAPLDALHHARPEPNIVAWQELRGMIEDAVVAILAEVKTSEEAARDLQDQARAVLTRDQP